MFALMKPPRHDDLENPPDYKTLRDDYWRLFDLNGAITVENEAVKAALSNYHHALDTRKHGGVAAQNMIWAVEAAFGKPWIRKT